MILKFDKKEFTKSWNKWGLGAWCQTWIRMGLLDPKGIVTIVIICSLIAGIFYWKGIKNTPVEIGNDLIAYDKEFTLRLDKVELSKLENPALKKPKNSRLLYYYDWRNDTLGNPIKVEDIEELRKKLKPYGWESKLIGVMGIGASLSDVSAEAGIGYRYVKLWQIRGEMVVTNKGIYPLSVSFKPDWVLSNTSVGVSGGKAWEDGSGRVMVGINTEF